MDDNPSRQQFQAAYEGKPPWDLGRPQKAFVEVADQIAGSVLDAGCGTGDNALFFAQRGHPVLGIDFVEFPIMEAKRKAKELGVEAEFLQMATQFEQKLKQYCQERMVDYKLPREITFVDTMPENIPLWNRAASRAAAGLPQQE